MDWKEINIVIEALEALIEKYANQMDSKKLNEDEFSDVINDQSFAMILLANYKARRDSMLK